MPVLANQGGGVGSELMVMYVCMLCGCIPMYAFMRAGIDQQAKQAI